MCVLGKKSIEPAYRLQGHADHMRTTHTVHVFHLSITRLGGYSSGGNSMHQ